MGGQAERIDSTLVRDGDSSLRVVVDLAIAVYMGKADRRLNDVSYWRKEGIRLERICGIHFLCMFQRIFR